MPTDQQLRFFKQKVVNPHGSTVNFRVTVLHAVPGSCQAQIDTLFFRLVVPRWSVKLI